VVSFKIPQPCLPVSLRAGLARAVSGPVKNKKTFPSPPKGGAGKRKQADSFLCRMVAGHKCSQREKSLHN
jgi:hypothetical protein